MAQLSDDCFAFGGELMTAGEALALLAERLDVVVEPEPVALRKALGHSPFPLPFPPNAPSAAPSTN